MDNEEDIVQAAKHGDPDAWRALYDRYQPSLWGWLRVVTLGSPDLADYCQETWAAVVRYLPRYDHRDRFWPWLTTIARNIYRERWKRQRVRPRLVFGGDEADEALLTATSGADPLDTALQRAFAMALIKQLADPLDREVMVLRTWHDLTFGEIGERYGVSPNAILRRYESAIRELQVVVGATVAAKPKARRSAWLSPELQREAVRRWQSGELSQAALAELYGIPLDAMKRYVRALIGDGPRPPQRRRRHALTAEQEQEVIAHYAAGGSLDTLEGVYSCHSQTLRNIVKRAGLALPPRKIPRRHA